MMSPAVSMALTFAAIAFAFFFPTLAMRETQKIIPDLPRKPLPYFGGTDDARIWAAALREKTMAGTAARPGATVTQFPVKS